MANSRSSKQDSGKRAKERPSIPLKAKLRMAVRRVGLMPMSIRCRDFPLPISPDKVVEVGTWIDIRPVAHGYQDFQVNLLQHTDGQASVLALVVRFDFRDFFGQRQASAYLFFLHLFLIRHSQTRAKGLSFTSFFFRK